ncbi:MAG: hypothetical protein L0332_28030 [Chloroflexi bacterium]|nr:hypothetical protein [Chloroflexota bacterium]MCI0648861.1 hypothetical protein [Chloroflexota bacterium]MCI0730549.1 hypothetical protein [Chloroflexota bacterium]
MIQHPLTLIPAAGRRTIFWLLLLATLAVMAALNVLGGPLRTAAAPAGIVSYELAGDVTAAQAILDSWDSLTRVYAGFNLGLDYLFLPLYGTTIALGCLWAADALRLAGRKRAAVVWLAWGQWLAAGLDAVENAALLKMLLDAPADPWPVIAWGTAGLKFLLVTVGILLVSGAAVYRAVRRPGKTPGLHSGAIDTSDDFDEPLSDDFRVGG